MKQILLFLIIFISFCVNSNAQGNIKEIYLLNEELELNIKDAKYVCDSSVTFSWDSEYLEWIPKQKTIKTYTSGGSIQRYLREGWDVLNNEWLNKSRYNYSYNYINNSKQTERINQKWDNITNDWINVERSNYNYNSDGNLVEHLCQSWERTSLVWVNLRIISYTVNDQGSTEGYIEQNWKAFSSVWENYKKHTYTYDNNNNLTEYFLQNWDVNSQNWINNLRVKYEYNSDINVECTYQVYDINSSNWNNKLKYNYFFNENGNLIESTYEEWESEEWSSKFKHSWTFDSYGYEVEYLKQEWNNNLSDWVNYSKEQYTNNNGNLTETVKMIWDVNTLEWVNSEKISSYFSLLTNINNNNLNHNLIFYPNPAKDKLVIISNNPNSNLSIFDINGRILIQRNIMTNEECINISCLKTGVYIIKLVDGSQHMIAKFIKK